MKLKNSFDSKAYYYKSDLFKDFPFQLIGFTDRNDYINTYLSDLVVFALQDENFDFRNISKSSIIQNLDEVAVNVIVNSIYQGKKKKLKL